MFLPLHPYAEQWAAVWLADNKLASTKIVAVHLGASDSTRCWPVASFSKLVEMLVLQCNCRVVVVGAGDAVQLAQNLRAQCSQPFFDLTGKTTVAQAASLIKRCHLMISNDSGPMHMAAAAGIYVIAIFLRNQPGINAERWKPLGPRGFVLANRPNEAVQLDRSGHVISGHKDSVRVQEVLRLAQDLLQRTL